MISLARGVPAPECIPVEELADCARAAILNDGAAALSYGPGGGYAPLRAWIAEQHSVDASRVVVTNGSLQGFVFLADLLAGKGSRVIVEAPTYDRPLAILDALGADIGAVPQTDDGIDIDRLAEELRRAPRAAFLYVIPTFQNPSGRTLAPEGRRRLVELAAEHDVLVLEDDPYGLVRFEGIAPPTLYELEGGARVIYSSSFSKTVAPGVRVGYLVLPQPLAGRVAAAAAATYITPSLLAQATVYEFLWLELPDEVDAAELLAAAERIGVTFVPGPSFFPRGGGGRSTARLAFSFASPSQLAVAGARLGSLLSAAPVDLRQQHAASP